jgi:hypothetical protein
MVTLIGIMSNALKYKIPGKEGDTILSRVGHPVNLSKHGNEPNNPLNGKPSKGFRGR